MLGILIVEPVDSGAANRHGSCCGTVRYSTVQYSIDARGFDLHLTIRRFFIFRGRRGGRLDNKVLENPWTFGLLY